MGDGGISPKNALMGVIGGWGYFKRDGGISNQEDTMVYTYSGALSKLVIYMVLVRINV